MVQILTRQQGSDGVTPLGWRYVIGTARTSVAVPSLAAAATVAQRVIEAAGDDADGHLRIDLRPDRLVFTVQSPESSGLTAIDLDVVGRISAALAGLGVAVEPGPTAAGGLPVQLVEIAIDALDIPAVLPFWRAVLGYEDDGSNGLRDPLRIGPSIWFQQMDKPREQRNRIHFDVLVSHDEAAARIAAALAAGGTLLSEREAPAFWVLADTEGNEACVCTWQGRD